MKQMEIIKKYRSVLAVVIPVLLMVLVWQYGRSHFKSDARRWAAPSFSKENLISYRQVSSIPGDKLLINIDSCNTVKNQSINSVADIPATNYWKRRT